MQGDRVLPLLALLLACGCKEPQAQAPAANATRSFAEPPLLEDLDPAEGRFEGEITAAATTLDLTGDPVDFLTYNGTVPGPLLKVAVGDQVDIHFYNELPTSADWSSTIHWHGIEGYNASDGTPVTQLATEQGAGFDYHFKATRAGIFWYHPHIRGSQALFSGLYAPLVVVDPDEATLVDQGILPADDRVLVLSDTWTSQGIVTSAEVDDAREIMNGTEGKDIFVNGLEDPIVEVQAGSAVRLRLVNTSIARFWRLVVPGKILYRVGGEGGLLDAVRVEGGTITGERFDPTTGASLGQTEVDLGYNRGEIVLAPAERADVVLVTDGAPGEEWSLRWEDFARGRHDMWMEGDEMMMGDAADDGLREGTEVARFRLVEGDDAAFSIAEGDPILTAVGRSVGSVDDSAALDWFDDDGTTLDEEMDHVPDGNGNLEMTYWFGMNGLDWTPDHMGGPTQEEAPSARHAKLGDTLRWEVRNNSMMAHPFHLHGFSYQPYELVRWANPEDEESDGSAVRISIPYDEFEDTTLLPPYSSLYFKVRIADPEGDGSAAGRWVEHCHILQHGEHGMMSELVVDP